MNAPGIHNAASKVEDRRRIREAPHTPKPEKARRNFLYGELAEWSNAAVLKTVDCNRSGGSNPSLSAILSISYKDVACCLLEANSVLLTIC